MTTFEPVTPPADPATGQPGPTEVAVIDMWRGLGLPARSPGDDFFALGGESLTLVRFLARVQDRWGLELPVDAIFETDFTVAAAAALIEQEQLATADEDELAAAMAELEGMSEEEIRALLGDDPDR